MINKEVIQLEDSNFILIETLNARQIRISTNCNKIKYEEISGEIISININEKLSIQKNNHMQITVNKQVHNYNISIITKLSNNSFLISTNYPTKCKHFILPTLGNNKENFQTENYLEDVRLGKELDKLYLTYRYFKGELYNFLERFIMNHPNYVQHNDSDTGHVIYEFNIPAKFLKDVKLFKEGKYSQFSGELKSKIMSFYGLRKGGDTYNILYKEKALREQLELEFMCELPPNIELYDIPTLNKELID